MKKNLPEIKVIEVKEREDGSADVTFEVSDDFKELVKKEYPKKRITKKLVGEFILKLLEQAEKEGVYEKDNT